MRKAKAIYQSFCKNRTLKNNKSLDYRQIAPMCNCCTLEKEEKVFVGRDFRLLVFETFGRLINMDIFNKLYDYLSQKKSNTTGNDMKTITFCSFKGGTSKTSTALNLGACLAKLHDKKILLVDLDPQANLSVGLGIGADRLETMVPVLQEKAKIESVIIETGVENLSIIPSNAYLDGVEKLPPLGNDCYAHERVRKALEGIKGDYDYCFIDTPPSLGWLTQSAFFASEYSVVCAIPEAYSVIALERLKEFHEKINEHHAIEVLGVVLTFWNDRGAINEELLGAIDESFPKKTLKSKVRRDMVVSRAVFEGVSVLDFDPSSRAAQDYKALAEEFLDKAKKAPKKKKEKAHV